MNQTEEIQNTEENEDELYEHHRFTIDKGQEPTRIDKFLTIRIVGISRNKIQNAIDAGNVLVNGKPVKANYKTRPLDLVKPPALNPAVVFYSWLSRVCHSPAHFRHLWHFVFYFVKFQLYEWSGIYQYEWALVLYRW